MLHLKEGEGYALVIKPRDFSRIMEMARATELEVSGIGEVDWYGGLTGRVVHLFPLMEQQCSMGETEISSNLLHMIARSPESSRFNFDWHSHNKMGVFWSNTDEEAISSMLKVVSPCFSLVVNHKKEYLARMDILEPLRIRIDLSIRYDLSLSKKEVEAIKADVAEKVKRAPIPTIVTSPHSSFGRVGGYQYEGGYGYGHAFGENMREDTRRRIEQYNKERDESDKQSLELNRKLMKESEEILKRLDKEGKIDGH